MITACIMKFGTKYFMSTLCGGPTVQFVYSCLIFLLLHVCLYNLCGYLVPQILELNKSGEAISSDMHEMHEKLNLGSHFW